MTPPTPEAIAALKAKLAPVIKRHAKQGWPSDFHPEWFTSRIGPEFQVAHVHDMINDRIKYQPDWRTFWQGRHRIPESMKNLIDRWETPAEALARGRGDCEEFAIAKALMLAELGHTTWLAFVEDWHRGKWIWHCVALVGEEATREVPTTDLDTLGMIGGSEMIHEPDTRIVLDIPGRPKYGKPWTVARMQMVGPKWGYRWWPELIFEIGDANA